MTFLTRIAASFRTLTHDQRLAALACGLLFATMLLPWYTRDATAVVKGELQKQQDTLTAFGSFSFVEAAVLVVSIGVLVLLFHRGERRAFHLPGGDGTVILAAGVWVCVLVFYRFVDNKDGSISGFTSVDYGVTWGIFVTFLCGALLAYAGMRLRESSVEPPLPAAGGPPPDPPDQAPTRVARRDRPVIDGGEQLTFDEQE